MQTTRREGIRAGGDVFSGITGYSSLRELVINVVKTMQPVEADKSALIIDIDVSTTRETPGTKESLDRLLPTMRWLKNMVFFELLTTKAIDAFREPKQ